MTTKLEKTFEFDAPNTILRRTRALLLRREILEVHVETKIPYYWLRKLRSNEPLRGANVNRVQFLYEYLSGEPVFPEEK
jgi:hypothetical protein